MEWFVVALVTVIGAIWWWKKRVQREPEVSFTIVQPVLDKHTRQSLDQLINAMGEQFDVFPKVSLAEIVDYEVAEDRVSQRYADELDAASVDLLVMDKQSGEVRCVVMLSRHSKPGSRQLLIRQVCQQAKLPFLMLDVHNPLTDKEIRNKIIAMSEPTIRTDDVSTSDIRIYLEPGQKR